MPLPLSRCYRCLARSFSHQHREQPVSRLLRGLGQCLLHTSPIGSRHSRTVRLFLSWVDRHSRSHLSAFEVLPLLTAGTFLARRYGVTDRQADTSEEDGSLW